MAGVPTALLCIGGLRSCDFADERREMAGRRGARFSPQTHAGGARGAAPRSDPVERGISDLVRLTRRTLTPPIVPLRWVGEKLRTDTWRRSAPTGCRPAPDVLSSPSLLANGTWRGWSAPRSSRPTGADDGPARRPGARRSAWQALVTDLHALAFGQGHGAGGLDRVGRARWAPSMRRVSDSAVVVVAWVMMAPPGRPRRDRERSNGSIALPPAYRGGTLLPGRPGVVQGILLG